MSQFKTAQEEFWAGEFGEQYINRNDSQLIIASNARLFSQIFSRTIGVDTVLELGANIGMNLQAIQFLKPTAKISAVEINQEAAKKLKALGLEAIYVDSIINLSLTQQYDFVFSKGVLIHINPDVLPQVYETMYKTSKKYICLVEYYNPSPVAISYRGHQDRLFKRDFCGEMMNKYADLKLIDYGFVYHRDNNFPGDDTTWFLLEKSK